MAAPPDPAAADGAVVLVAGVLVGVVTGKGTGLCVMLLVVFCLFFEFSLCLLIMCVLFVYWERHRFRCIRRVRLKNAPCACQPSLGGRCLSLVSVLARLPQRTNCNAEFQQQRRADRKTCIAHWLPQVWRYENTCCVWMLFDVNVDTVWFHCRGHAFRSILVTCT